MRRNVATNFDGESGRYVFATTRLGGEQGDRGVKTFSDYHNAQGSCSARRLVMLDRIYRG